MGIFRWNRTTSKFTSRIRDLYLVLIPLVDQAIISVATFVTTILLVSLTNLAVFGEISYRTVLALIGQSLIFSVIILPMNLLAVQHKQDVESFLSASIALMFLAAAATALVFYAVFLLIDGKENAYETLMFCLAFITICVQDCGRRQLYLRS